MIRAAAKNAAWVAVVTDPGDYAALLAALREGGVSRALRARLAAKAFARTAAYDAAIAAWYARALGRRLARAPRRRRRAARAAALRREPAPVGRALSDRRAGAERRHGAAGAGQGALLQQHQRRRRRLRARLRPAAGAARPSPSSSTPIPAARRSAPTSPRPIAKALALRSGLRLWRHRRGEPAARRAAAEAITGIFTEVVVAPDADEEAIAIFAGKPNLRLLLTGGLADPARAAAAAEERRRRPARAGARLRRASPRADCRVVTQPRARASARWPTCSSPSASPST